ncbi:MAG TPA: galactose oxidase-like domain-containing protein [Saprospiraceae bacterium]|nr:galactose oxidase-like domain-containing protein [Saprospiraceae bacterium]
MKNIFAAIFCLLLNDTLSAQVLTGTILDVAAIPISNARITLFNNDTTMFWEARTDKNGIYWIDDLPEGGPYLFFGVSAPGFDYFENATTGILDTLVWDAVLLPETQTGVWDIIMESPEPLGGTDLGVLMPNGNVYYCHSTKDPFFFVPPENDTAWAPGHTQVQGCVANALLTNGKVLFAGGTDQKIYGPGTNKVKTFDEGTGQWEYLSNLLDYRWYPSLAPLYDGKVLIVGGGGLNNPVRVKTSEVYDPMTGDSEPADAILYGNEVSPIIPLFTGKILMTHRPPQLFDPLTFQWELADDFVQGNRLPNGDHSDHELVHLPDGKVLAVGFKSFTPGQPGVNLEQYDPVANQWELLSNFSPTRSRAKVVLTPDKKVLVMGGQKEDPNDPTSVNNWGYMNLTDQYNPATDTWRRLEHMKRMREYHAITVLVPDGRIIAVGGEGAPGNEPPQSVIEAFSPPYLFRGIRPEIENLNANTFRRGQIIDFEVSKTNALTGVILMSNAVVTHFMNSGNNRYLDLDFIQNGNQVQAFLPSDSLQLMQGWYMLFGMVDDIPSVGKIIKIEPGSLSTSVIENGPDDAIAICVFPNPSHGKFTIEITGLRSEETVRVEIFDLNGALVFRDDLEFKVGSTKTNIAVDRKGIFMVKVSGDRKVFAQKLLIH